MPSTSPTSRPRGGETWQCLARQKRLRPPTRRRTTRGRAAAEVGSVGVPVRPRFVTIFFAACPYDLTAGGAGRPHQSPHMRGASPPPKNPPPPPPAKPRERNKPPISRPPHRRPRRRASWTAGRVVRLTWTDPLARRRGAIVRPPSTRRLRPPNHGAMPAAAAESGRAVGGATRRGAPRASPSAVAPARIAPKKWQRFPFRSTGAGSAHRSRVPPRSSSARAHRPCRSVHSLSKSVVTARAVAKAGDEGAVPLAAVGSGLRSAPPQPPVSAVDTKLGGRLARPHLRAVLATARLADEVVQVDGAGAAAALG